MARDKIDESGLVGRCGERAPELFPTPASKACELPAGHAGWHKDGITEWSADHPPLPTIGVEELVAEQAGLSAEQEIRARAAELWLADKRQYRYTLAEWAAWIRDGKEPSDG